MAKIGFSMRSTRNHSAFSLLELIIVLVVMIGLMAIVWPNLQRPLSRTTVAEAAQMLRDVIDESRYQANIQGVPQFIHLSQGQSEFQSGALAAFLDANQQGIEGATAAELRSADAARTSASLIAPKVKLWRLPATVVISQLSWTASSPVVTDELDEVLTSDRDAEPLASQSMNSAIVGSSMSAAESFEGELQNPLGSLDSQQQWWLPFLPTGQGRDFRIELVDRSIQQTLTVTYESATGALEISK